MTEYGLYFRALEKKAADNNLPFMGNGKGQGVKSAAEVIADDDGQNSQDSIDTAQKSTARDIAITVLNYRCNLSRLIQLALERMRNREYETCMACENEISSKRLLAVPETPFCINCQNNLDKGKLDGFEHWSVKTPTIGGSRYATNQASS